MAVPPPRPLSSSADRSSERRGPRRRRGLDGRAETREIGRFSFCSSRTGRNRISLRSVRINGRAFLRGGISVAFGGDFYEDG